VLVHSYARQIDGCASRVEETIVGTEGIMRTAPGRAACTGKRPWTFEGPDNEPYGQEHVDLVRAIHTGVRINETKNVSQSTLVAIMGRLSAYTGKVVTWEQALNLQLDLSPKTYEMGSLETPKVAQPGTTPLA
jgi:hypothetical protein